jgi:hypothetical protein
MTDRRPVSLFSVQTVQQLGEELGLAVDQRGFRANVYVDFSSASGFGMVWPVSMVPSWWRARCRRATLLHCWTSASYSFWSSVHSVRHAFPHQPSVYRER